MTAPALKLGDAQVYLVGGAVRDKLLGRHVTDRDWVVVGATPELMLNNGFTPVGKDFPVFLHPQTHEEYALARTERKSGHGYYGFTIYSAPDVTLEQDLSRRDLTINAMARASDGTMVDPYYGQRDLKNRTLRHVSPAFSEDPLRVLRVARFAARYNALGFTVDGSTLSLMQTISESGELATLAAERVWQETQRALTDPCPVEFIRVLRYCGALAKLFPEVEALYGVPQTAQWHPEIDTGIHNEMALQQATEFTDDAQTRFAVLCHDLGKATTPADILPSHRGHEERGANLTKLLCKRLKVPSDYRDLAIHTARYHLHSHRAFELNPATLVKMLMALDGLRKPERFEQFLIACEADARGRLGLEEQPYPQADYLRGALAALKQSQSAIAEYAQTNKDSNIAEEAHRIRLKTIKNYCRQTQQ